MAGSAGKAADAMEIRHLVQMANEIGAFFEAWPDRVEAVTGIADHLRNFWEPRMRREIIAYVHRSGGADLKGIVREAIGRLEAQTTGVGGPAR